MASQRPPSGQMDALDVLIEDHRRMRTLFRAFREQPADKSRVIELACSALSAHTQVEEAIFYPALQEEIGNRQLVEEARVEHDTVKQLMSKLQSGMLDDAARDATFTVMARMVERHIEEEEGELFDQVRKASMDLAALGQKMRGELDLLEQNPVLTRGQHSLPRGTHEHAG
jgi:hemerythrin-like domain-containing protein